MYGDRRGDELPEELQDPVKRLKKIEEAMPHWRPKPRPRQKRNGWKRRPGQPEEKTPETQGAT